jgi:RNA polymerase sigma-70 factor (ECF subfamily)
LDDADLRRAMIALLPDLRAYARFLARGPAESDDLVQEAVVRALAAVAQFQPGSSPRAWMFTILRNAFYEQARRRRTERAAIAEAVQDEPSAVLPAAQGQVELGDLSRHLYALSPLFREALVLVGAQGFGYEEAAAICGVPVGTMKARVSRARGLLARSMSEPQPR